MKKYIMTGLIGLLGTVAAVGAELFAPSFEKRPGGGDWVAVYSHLADKLVIGGGAVSGPIPSAAHFELKMVAQKEDAGKAAYFRSRAIAAGERPFSVEWWQLVVAGGVNPAFELWGGVGAKPTEAGTSLARIGITATGSVVMGKTILGAAAPGWRHFKIFVRPTEGVMDFYCDNMKKAVVTSVGLAQSATDWSRVGVGFSLYVSPGTPPTVWSVGGVRVTAP